MRKDGRGLLNKGGQFPSPERSCFPDGYGELDYVGGKSIPSASRENQLGVGRDIPQTPRSGEVEPLAGGNRVSGGGKSKTLWAR